MNKMNQPSSATPTNEKRRGSLASVDCDTPLTKRGRRFSTVTDGSVLETPRFEKGAITDRPSSSAKLKKRERKAVKRAAKAELREKVVTEVEVQKLATVLHPTDHKQDVPPGPGRNDGPENAVLQYLQQQEVDAKKAPSYAELSANLPDFNDLTARALQALNLSEEAAKSKEYKTLLKQVTAAIQEDFVEEYKDEVEVARRREGYYRFVTRKAIVREAANYEASMKPVFALSYMLMVEFRIGTIRQA